MPATRRPTFRRCLLACVLWAVGLGSTATAPAGTPPTTAFGRTELGGNGQVVSIAQDPRGFLYFAMPSVGVVEYDGETFEPIRATRSLTGINALAADPRGRLWLAGRDAFGRLERDASGRWAYLDLRAQLPAGHHEFSQVWPVVAWDDEVFFVGYESLFRWHDGIFTAWPASRDQVIYRAYRFGDRRFFPQQGVGLLELRGGELEPIEGSELLADDEINAMFALDGDADRPNRFVLATLRRGLWLWDGGPPRPLEGRVSDWLMDALPQHGARLEDGRFAIGTRQRGLALIAPDLETFDHFDPLPVTGDSTIAFVLRDRDGAVWLGGRRGVVRLPTHTALMRYDAESGLIGGVSDVVQRPNGLAVATRSGLFLETEPGRGRFAQVPGSPGNPTALLAVGDDLLITSGLGVFELERRGSGGIELQTVRQITDERAMHLFRSRWAPDVVFVSLDNGVATLRRKSDGWTWHGRLPELKTNVRQAVDGPSGEMLLRGLQPNRLFISVAGAEADENIHVHELEGVAAGRLLEIDGEIVSARAGEVERYRGLASVQAGEAPFAPDPRLGSIVRAADEDATLVAQGADGSLWIADESSVWRAEADRGNPIGMPRLLARGLPGVVDVRTDADGSVGWVRTLDGLFRVDSRRDAQPLPPLEVYLRRVRRLDETPIDPSVDGSPPTLERADASLRFEFAAPSYGPQREVRYRFRLTGFDDTWSPWRARSAKEYTRLPAGRFAFEVQARDDAGRQSVVATYPFAVRAPWYATGWAQLLWGTLTVGLIAGAARWRSAHLRHRNRTLETTVADRTRELAREKSQVESQARALESVNRRLADENHQRRLLEEEKSRMQGRMEQSQRLESLGIMAGGIAHDFNNILMAVLGNADLCLSEPDLPRDMRDRVHSISRASQRAADLCRQMLSFAGRETLSEDDVDLAEVGRDTLDLVRASVPPTVRFVTDFEPDLPRVHGDGTKLGQVLLNLLLNAAEAARDGTVHLKLATRHLDRLAMRHLVLADPIPEGEYVVCSVRDDGPGIDPEIAARIFEPFFTTKFAGRGLGLAATLGIARSHGGAVRVDSTPGTGTTMEIFLPALPTTSADPEREARAKIDTAVGGYVLVVDDEELVLEVTGLMLRNLGYHALEAADADEALSLVRTSAPIDVAIVDLTMPDLDGLELGRQLQTERPLLPIILSSGGALDDIGERFLDSGFVAFLHKPYRSDALARSLRQAIEARQKAEADVGPTAESANAAPELSSTTERSTPAR